MVECVTWTYFYYKTLILYFIIIAYGSLNARAFLGVYL